MAAACDDDESPSPPDDDPDDDAPDEDDESPSLEGAEGLSAGFAGPHAAALPSTARQRDMQSARMPSSYHMRPKARPPPLDIGYTGPVIPIPLNDENPTSTRPVVTVTLIVANAAFWFYELARGVTLSVLDYGVIPRWMLHGISSGGILLPGGIQGHLQQEVPWPLTLLTAMFAHGGWMHIIGNMWFLWIFGDNLEDRMGPLRYTLFYLACGLLAAGTQVLATPDSVAPMVGASGAIAGVLGGYILLYPAARVRCLWVLIVFVTTVRIPAFVLLGLWVLSQVLTPASSGVAWQAHVGGFLAGLALVKLFIDDPPPAPLYYGRGGY